MPESQKAPDNVLQNKISHGHHNWISPSSHVQATKKSNSNIIRYLVPVNTSSTGSSTDWPTNKNCSIRSRSTKAARINYFILQHGQQHG